ncbi:hypothetical protein [Acrocarpospora sp. B8E8]|uniref:hypothetical protein n=1 Tax=Acrocarpospora sp. B8E8 TaxID=3153572 RepID=UPI00325F9C61
MLRSHPTAFAKETEMDGEAFFQLFEVENVVQVEDVRAYTGRVATPALARDGSPRPTGPPGSGLVASTMQ